MQIRSMAIVSNGKITLMDQQQDKTKPQAVTIEKAHDRHKAFEHLTLLEYDWLTFCAAGGLVTHEDGELQTMTITEFARHYKVDRQKLWRMKYRIPNWDNLMRMRRKQLFNESRLSKIINGLYLKAAAGHAKQAEMLWSYFGDYVPPQQKEQATGDDGFAELLRKRQKRKEIGPGDGNTSQ